MEDHGRALKDLLLRATRAAPDVDRLEGDDGLTASIEHSALGPARMIRVDRSGTERWRNVLVQPGEPRPDFYPADVPFTARAFCSATWSADFGLAVLWSLPVEELDLPGREELASPAAPEDPDAVQEFVRRFLTANKRDKLRMVQEFSGLVDEPFMRRLEEAFGAVSQEELPAQAQALTAEVITYHAQTGWEVSPAPDHRGPGYGWILTAGERRRELSARSMLGVSTLTLAERSWEWPPSFTRGGAR